MDASREGLTISQHKLGEGARRRLSRDPQQCVRDSMSGASGHIIGGWTEPRMHKFHLNDGKTPSHLSWAKGKPMVPRRGTTRRSREAKSAADGASAVGSQ